jgi:DNA-binding transcriptional MocR family regulator
MSITTVYSAFLELEKRDIVLAREKSGYYVKPLLEDLLPFPQIPTKPIGPGKVTVNNLSFALCEAMTDPDVLQLGGALIHPDLLPAKSLYSSLRAISSENRNVALSTYEHFMGYLELRRQIAKRADPIWGPTSANQIVVTNGCMEAVSLCLQSVAQAGDTILVSSPTFPWFLQLIEDFGMYALEIPAITPEGIDISLVLEAINRYTIQACILMANFSNPLGYLMPDEKKKELVDLLSSHRIPLIEDDIYGELYFDSKRPIPFKAFDRTGNVLYCASFSKTLSPGLRVGWTAPGIYLDTVRRRKLNQNIANPGITQIAAANFLQAGNFDRHLRRLRTNLKHQVSNMALAIARFFPAGTKISSPRGGFTLWVQCPDGLDSLNVFRRALKNQIAILPGIICATTGIYGNCIRISCGMPYDDHIEAGIKVLADIVNDQLSESNGNEH